MPAPRDRPLALGTLLALAMGAGPLVNHGFTALSPLLVTELGLSTVQYGALWTVTFGVGAALTMLGARVFDQVAPRVTLTAVFSTAALGLVAAGLASSYAWLVVAAVLGGLSQSVATPVTNQVVSRSLPRRSWGLALGLKQSGVQVAQFVTGITLPTLALLWGRDAGFVVLTALPVVGLLLVRRLVPARPSPVDAATEASAPARLPAHVTWLTVYAFIAGASQQAVNVHLPLYAHDAVGVPVTRAGLLVAAVGVLGIVARMVWSRGAGRLPDVRAPLLWMGVLGFGSATVLGAGTWLGEWVVWLGAALFACGALAANALIMLVVVRVVPATMVGRASGRTAGALFAGFMAGPVGFGLLVDGPGGYPLAWAAVASATVAMVVVTQVWRRVPVTQP